MYTFNKLLGGGNLCVGCGEECKNYKRCYKCNQELLKTVYNNSCKYCNKTNLSSLKLNEHMNTEHYNEKIYSCSICKNGVKMNEDEITKHRKKEHPEELFIEIEKY